MSGALPYWLATAPQHEPADPLPREVDVAVVGGGLTGLAASLRLAEKGASVAVLEQGRFLPLSDLYFKVKDRVS